VLTTFDLRCATLGEGPPRISVATAEAPVVGAGVVVKLALASLLLRVDPSPRCGWRVSTTCREATRLLIRPRDRVSQMGDRGHDSEAQTFDRP
jgi:hypothetical protein